MMYMTEAFESFNTCNIEKPVHSAVFSLQMGQKLAVELIER